MKKTIIILLGLMFISNTVGGLVTVYYGTTFYGNYLELSFASNGYNMSYLEVGDDYFNIDNMYLNMTGLSSSFTVNVSSHNGSINLTRDTVVLRFNASYSGTVSFEFTGNTTHNAVYSVYDYTDSSYVLTEGSIDSEGLVSFDVTFGIEHDIEIELDYYLPDPPYAGVADYDKNHRLNLSWSRGNYSDREVLIRKSGSYPSSHTDGTEVQNSTALFYNETITSSGYYTVWSYNDTTSGFSSTGLNIPWGAINISVYNESNFAELIDPFALLISNQDGTSTYQNYSCNSNHILDVLDIPYGDNTIFKLNATGYRERIYYDDLAVNNLYNLTFYLPPIETEVDEGGGDTGGSGTNYTTTRSYTVHVVDTNLYPIDDATVTVARYNNETDTYVDIASDITDGNGDCQFNLIPNVLYRVTLTKTNYLQTGDKYWTPDPDYYGLYYPKQFQMELDTSITDNTSFWNVINFNATKYSNNSIKIFFEDTDSETIDAQFYTYELYNFTESLNATNTTTSNSFTFWVTGINISRIHKITCHLNHTTLGYIVVSITVNPLRTPEYTRADIEDKASGVFGNWELGYVNFFLLFIPVILMLVAFGSSHVGLGVIASGLYIGFANIFISVPSEVTYLIPIIIAIGFILIIIKKGRVNI